MTTFETAKVGDKVWCLYYNKWLTITNIRKEDAYPIKTEINSYTLEGRLNTESIRTLFWDEVIITPPEKPLPKLEVDTKVLVWDSESHIKHKRYFSHFDSNSTIHVFNNGTTSWTNTQTVEYRNWELAKD